MKKTILILSIATAIIFSACKKDNTVDTSSTPGPRDYSVSVNGKIVTVNNLGADTVLGIGAQGPYGSGKFTFFNLASHNKVNSQDSATKNWDIAFRGSRILVNCGTSGLGLGGAFVYNSPFDGITSIPTDSTFKSDNAPSYAISGWYTYDGANMLFNAIPGKTIIVRTANGVNYAKIEILNYYRGGVTPSTSASTDVKAYDSRYYTFRYTYQADSTTNF